MVRKDSVVPHPGEGRRGEDGYLGYLLRQAANAYRSRAERALRESGLTHPQFTILTMLNAYPGSSNAELARVALLTPQTVHVIVGRLQAANMVASRPHPSHGRIQQLELTQTGREHLGVAKMLIDELERELEAGLRDQELHQIRRWLVRVATDASNDEAPHA